MIPALCAFPPYVVPKTLYGVLQQLGLTTGLQTCLDAGDLASYPGSGQTWTDETGNGYSFFLGTTGSVEPTDPTFNGTAGTQTVGDYFSVNGSQWFTLNQANPAWVQQMHKAGGKFTIIEWAYANNATTSNPYAGVGDVTTGASFQGVEFGNDITTATALNIAVPNGPGLALNLTSTIQFNNNAWNMVGVACDFSAPTETFVINGTTESHAVGLSSPSTSNASNTLQLAALGGGTTPDTNGNRFSAIAMWNTALTAAQMTSIFTAMRGKYGV